jgi:hypothetical protein
MMELTLPLGLSEQMPGRILFLTNSAPKRIKIDNQIFLFRQQQKKTCTLLVLK